MLFVISSAQAAYYYPQYFVTGAITDKDNAGTSGREVVFYENSEFLKSGIYVSSNAVGSSYLLNAYGPIPPVEIFANVGNSYFVYIPNDKPDNPSQGYGADAVSVKLSGQGIDVANLELKKAGGAIAGGYITPPEPGAGAPGGLVGNPPLFDMIKFGDRIYQKALVEKGEKFIVSQTPKISAKVTSALALKMDKLSIKINEAGGPTPSYTYQIKEANIISKEIKGKAAGEITALAFSYDLSEENKLGEGANTISFLAENAAGATAETVTVTVFAGQVRVLGDVLTHPSPFSPSRNNEVTIQYTLTVNGNIDVFVFSPTGEIVKKFSALSGQSGGTAGVNKIKWDGRKPSGALSGNGIYTGAIVAKDEGKILARLKLTIVD